MSAIGGEADVQKAGNYEIPWPLSANSGHRPVKRSAVQDAGYRFLPGRVTDALYLAEKITFAQVESAVSQQVVGGRHMKIEIRQHKAQQIALAGEIYGVTPEL